MSYPGCYSSSSSVTKPQVARGVLSLLVLADILLAQKHQETCTDCHGKPLWLIGLNVKHLLGR